jgi:hypothetical protein
MRRSSGRYPGADTLGQRFPAARARMSSSGDNEQKSNVLLYIASMLGVGLLVFFAWAAWLVAHSN